MESEQIKKIFSKYELNSWRHSKFEVKIWFWAQKLLYPLTSTYIFNYGMVHFHKNAQFFNKTNK